MNHGPPFHAAVLGEFRDQFIANVDVNAVVFELFNNRIISKSLQARISMTDEPKEQNEILHEYLQRTCTREALMEVCDMFVTVQGNPRMRHLGEAMKRRLHTGKCVVC